MLAELSIFRRHVRDQDQLTSTVSTKGL